MMKFLFTICLILLSFFGFANNLAIENVSFEKESGLVKFDLSWENSWRNDKNYDAAWVFVKFVSSDKSSIHGKLGTKGHSLQINGVTPSFVLPKDKVGMFIQSGSNHRGDVTWNVSLKIEEEILITLPDTFETKVFGLEMVNIPSGEFYVGQDPTQMAIEYSSFYQSDAEGKSDGPYLISEEEQEIRVDATEGNLYYQVYNQAIYRGDQKGTVPASFPKGVRSFYIMKYETTQGFYVDFLNSIPKMVAQKLSPHNSEDYYQRRGSIIFQNGEYVAKSRNRPANYITWDDGAAMADWAGLRPMTELEFTKAARGSVKPDGTDFPWGTNSKEGLKRIVSLEDELIFVNDLSEGDLSDENRHTYGASYYWVMDLAGSLWEKCVSIGHPIGREFKGTHGDGVMSENGTATNSDWPKGINEEGGYGYRGGGYYTHDMKVSDFNPHSPISFRPYGSWSGGKRSIAYSQRYVRSGQ